MKEIHMKTLIIALVSLFAVVAFADDNAAPQGAATTPAPTAKHHHAGKKMKKMKSAPAAEGAPAANTAAPEGAAH
jgi:hypothetical protein